MRIGIIGAGHIGGTLARLLTEAGHDVCIANSRGPETLTELADQTGATAVTAHAAARAGEVVVVTIPMVAVPDLADDLFEGVPDSVVVIDTCNYYPRQRDGRIDAIEAGLPESRWVEQNLGRPVVKVFNNIYAAHLGEKGKPHEAAGRVALPVSGDDERAKATVMDLVDQLGFDAVDNGGIEASWRQQPGTPVYTADYDAAGVRKALEQASRERKPEWQATGQSPGSMENPL